MCFFRTACFWVVENNDFIDTALRRQKHQKSAAMLYKIESNWGGLAALILVPIVIIVGVFIFFTVTMPIAADYVSDKTTPETLMKISDKTYHDFVSLGLLHDSRLDKDKIKRAGEILAEVLTATDGGDYRIRLKVHRIGISADEEFAALMAHEIAHVHNRHGLRSFLKTVGFDFYLGQSPLFSIGTFSLLMMEAGIIRLEYSRQFENVANCSACRYLRDKNLSPSLLADALQKMDFLDNDEEDEEAEEEDEEDDIILYAAEKMLIFLSEHPVFNARTHLSGFCQ